MKLKSFARQRKENRLKRLEEDADFPERTTSNPLTFSNGTAPRSASTIEKMNWNEGKRFKRDLHGEARTGHTFIAYYEKEQLSRPSLNELLQENKNSAIPLHTLQQKRLH